MVDLTLPVSLEFWLECNEQDGLVTVETFDDEGQRFVSHLRRGCIADLPALGEHGAIYVEIPVDYDIKSRDVDWTQVLDPDSEVTGFKRPTRPPRRFTEAAVVYTPKLRLI
jgi:hypothetical protein